MPSNYLRLGAWNAICDSCGLKFKSYQLRKRWDGLMVCEKDFDTRHPQTLIRIEPEHVVPPWVRPQATDQYVLVCNIWESSPFADLAAADCAHADVGSPDIPYATLYAMYLESLVTNA